VIDRALRWLFFRLVVRPVVLVVLGTNVRHRERLPTRGPAILVANHNSHLDTMVLMTLLPSRLLPHVRPVAAADYFLRNRVVAWFALRIVGIIPIRRRPAAPHAGLPPAATALPPAASAPAPAATAPPPATTPPPAATLPPPASQPPASQPPPAADVLAGVVDALAHGDVVILFPEGSRGEPERLAELKSGVARLAERCPGVPIIPVFLHGLGKALPRGSLLPVPFFCDVFVGQPVAWSGNRESFLDDLKSRLQALAAEGQFAAWD
jgi:1-acyl-sn-glycerol-3-phosphate acyltransferase